MKTIDVQSRLASFVIAVVFLLQISPALAGAPKVGLTVTQGSRVPGLPVPGTETRGNKHRRPVEVTYTKWITTFPLMEGFTGGDVPGVFAGEVFQRQVSRDGRIIRLEAVYEVQAGDHSFTALIRGGTGETKKAEPASVSGAALLDGVILAGWRTGAHVHVEFQTTTNCPGAPDARTCFQGTITINPDSDD
jgi:hypothetical protein